MPNLIAEFIQAVAVNALAQALGELLVWIARRAAGAAKRKHPEKCTAYEPKHFPRAK